MRRRIPLAAICIIITENSLRASKFSWINFSSSSVAVAFEYVKVSLCNGRFSARGSSRHGRTILAFLERRSELECGTVDVRL